MPLKFLRSSLIRTPTPASPATAGSPGSRLGKLTAAYRQQQATQTTATSQTISQLSLQRQRLASAEVKADKPVDTYLKRSGQLVERRIGSLQAHLNQIMGKNEK